MGNIDNTEPKQDGIGTVFFGLGSSVGTEGPWPMKIRMPVHGVPEKDWPVATFWFERTWDSEICAELETHGLPGMPISDGETAEMVKQNVFVLARTLSREKAWENLHRADGTIFEYIPPAHKDSLTAKDPRVILAKAEIFLATSLKVKAWSLNCESVNRQAGNSETSSASGTKTSAQTKPKPTRKRRGSKSS